MSSSTSARPARCRARSTRSTVRCRVLRVPLAHRGAIILRSTQCTGTRATRRRTPSGRGGLEKSGWRGWRGEAHLIRDDSRTSRVIRDSRTMCDAATPRRRSKAEQPVRSVQEERAGRAEDSPAHAKPQGSPMQGRAGRPPPQRTTCPSGSSSHSMTRGARRPTLLRQQLRCSC